VGGEHRLEPSAGRQAHVTTNHNYSDYRNYLAHHGRFRSVVELPAVGGTGAVGPSDYFVSPPRYFRQEVAPRKPDGGPSNQGLQHCGVPFQEPGRRAGREMVPGARVRGTQTMAG
jgi:hypothetical protein